MMLIQSFMFQSLGLLFGGENDRYLVEDFTIDKWVNSQP